MLQGEIWYANLNPIKGSEQAGHRPVLIISGNMLNNTSLISKCVMKKLEYIFVCQGKKSLHSRSYGKIF